MVCVEPSLWLLQCGAKNACSTAVGIDSVAVLLRSIWCWMIQYDDDGHDGYDAGSEKQEAKSNGFDWLWSAENVLASRNFLRSFQELLRASLNLRIFEFQTRCRSTSSTYSTVRTVATFDRDS